MADIQLVLGGFTFDAFEVPEEISFGGEQMLAVHKLVGGQRVIDAMGADDMALDWGGRLRGPSALSRALYLDGLRKAGKPLTLTWSALSYTVVVKRFVCAFQRAYELPYSISCEVVSDNTAPVTSIQAVTVDDQVGDDIDAASDYGDDIDDPTLNSNLAAVASAIGQVTTFARASSTVIGSVLAPIAVAQARVAALMSTNTSTVSAGSTFCGMLAGAAPTSLAASLTGYSAAMSALASLQGLSAVLTRMSTNLQAGVASGAVLTQAGGNLYAIAAAKYGSPEEWTTLGEANSISDPALTGINMFRIPAQPDGAGGVWQP